MSKIDHADDAIDHGVADGDQAIDRAEHDAVDELLGEIVHAPPLCGAIFPARLSRFAVKKMPASTNSATMPLGSRNEESFHFLTAGTRCGNSATYGFHGLYM